MQFSKFIYYSYKVKAVGFFCFLFLYKTNSGWYYNNNTTLANPWPINHSAFASDNVTIEMTHLLKINVSFLFLNYICNYYLFLVFKKRNHHFYHVDFIKRCGSGKRRSCLVDAVIYLHLHALITKSWTPDTLELLPHKKILTRNKRASPNHKWYLGQIRRLDDDSR